MRKKNSLTNEKGSFMDTFPSEKWEWLVINYESLTENVLKYKQ